MSLRWRLVGGIVLLLTALWAVAAVWFFFDARAELRQVLDARLASSARMVQALIARGDVKIDITASEPRASMVPGIDADAVGEVACQLWSMEGRLLSSTTVGPELPGDTVPEGFSFREVNGEQWRIYALTDATRGLRILTAERRELRKALMREVATAVSAPFLLVLPATALLVWLGVGAGLAPLERIRRAVSRRNVDALAPLPDAQLPREIAPLAKALNDLLRRVAATVERERRFTGDAAHELRTPLAGLKAQLQVARAAQGEMRERALHQAEAAADRMSRLVSQLLLLARVENTPGHAAEPPQCAFRKEVEAVLKSLEPLAQQHDVKLHVEVAEATVALPASALHALLRNLIENAIRHTPAGKRVQVRSHCCADHLSLSIIDEGPGIPEQEIDKVTRPFYRAWGPQPDEGSGLGLSIVAAIVEQHNARVEFANRKEGGLQVTVHLPCVDSQSTASQRGA